jgi:type VI secretion system secreted protein VgrG
MTFGARIPYPLLAGIFQDGDARMSHAQDTPITLTITDNPLQLQVVSFKGHEALNQPYRFDIDLISATPDLDTAVLMSRGAFLGLGSGQGFHGVIGSARQLHAGRNVGHYRIRLEPRLSQLQLRRQRRIFQGMGAPQIIVQLLDEHGIGSADYRFEHTVGRYPPRPLCTQYDESDLHLLQRLCEEEGLHYRFEHQRSRHLLIFADDPASFPERPTPIDFQINDGRAETSKSISQMAERFSLSPSYSSHHPLLIDGPEGKQSGERRLQRLRCERRQVQGLSNQPSLLSGQIVRVTDHPDNLFNDQWLLTDIHHAGKQIQCLRRLDAEDITVIVEQILAQDRQSDSGIATFRRGYRNHFKAIPWAMPFRPLLKHHRPRVQGDERATLIGAAGQPIVRDQQGRVRARLHRQADVILWLPMILPADDTPLLAGSQVSVSYFDNDPDRPVISEVLACAEDQPQLWVDGLPRVPAADDIHVSAGQTLQAFAPETLTLVSPTSRIELSSRSIRIIGPQPPAGVATREPHRSLGKAPSMPAPDLSALFQWLDASCL